MYFCAIVSPLGLNTVSDIYSGGYMMNVKTFTINLELGQKILVGPNRKPAEITKIEWFERKGEIEIRTTKGKRKALTFALPYEVELAE
jgi:hypothetical protein